MVSNALREGGYGNPISDSIAIMTGAKSSLPPCFTAIWGAVGASQCIGLIVTTFQYLALLSALRTGYRLYGKKWGLVMIYAFAGSPGSFKSVHVLEKYIIPALKKGRAVYTNIEKISSIYIATYFDMNPIDVDNLLHILGREYNDDGTFQENPDLIRRFYDNVPNNALIVIDEAQNYFFFT